MKRYRAFLGLLLMFLLAGCGAIEYADVTTLVVGNRGNVVQMVVEPFDGKEEEKKDLKSMIQSSVKEYNQTAGAENVVLADLKFGDGQVKMMINYEDCSDYGSFNNVTFYSGTVEEAVTDLYDFDDTFRDSSGEEISGGELQKTCGSDEVLILEEPGQVKVPGKIRYVSSNVKILSGSTAEVQAGEEKTGITEKKAYIIYG